MVKLALLAAAFALTAMLYASVGFGGGSTYTALLIATGTDYRLVPLIALACNIAVVSGNTWRYTRAKLVPWRRLLPLIVLSIPAAWLGGRLEISETVFIGLLWIALAIAGWRLVASKERQDSDAVRSTPVWMDAGIGAAIGFYSGLVGIGGGIFLAPILHTLKWGRAKTIAACCSVFILVNSIAGLSGQWTKLAGAEQLSNALVYWPLLPAVIIGGWVGNYVGVFKLSPNLVKRLTGGLILLVAARLAWRWFGLI